MAKKEKNELKEIKIDEEKLEKIEKELKENKKRKKNDEKIKIKYKNIFRNIVLAIIIVAYFGILLLGSKKIPIIEYITDLKTFVIFELAVTIFIFERAFKKDDDSLAIHGIEMFAITATTVVILNLFSRESNKIIPVICISIVITCVYYLVKSVIIAIKKKK